MRVVPASPLPRRSDPGDPMPRRHRPLHLLPAIALSQSDEGPPPRQPHPRPPHYARIGHRVAFPVLWDNLIPRLSAA